jgi:3-dehydroquinate synthetase
MMKTKTKFTEPKGVLEVRAWKRKVSSDIERLGAVEFHKRAAIKHHDLFERIENARLAKMRKTA